MKARCFTAKQAKDLDNKIKEKFGISTLLLMENAGRAVAEESIKNNPKKVLVVCGTGNNGGDGLVSARHLLARGVCVEIYLLGRIQEIKNEAKTNLEILLRLKQKVIELNPHNLSRFKSKVFKADLIIDALLGVGLKGEVRKPYQQAIELINNSKAYILSVDIPSGLDANKGQALGCCVRADKTVTFVARKRGMVLGDGPKYCGKVVVVDLGVPLRVS